MVLPMYKSDDFNLRKSIVATISIDDTSTTRQLLKRLNNQYKLSKNLINSHQSINSLIFQDGIIICQPCSLQK